MNFDNIGYAILKIYDELKNDIGSKKIIRKIDTAKSDEKIKEGIVEGIKRLRELGKNDLASDIESRISDL